MSRPLTIDELKALEVGDWVWVTTENGQYGTYARVCQPFEDNIFRCESIETYLVYNISDYGKTWLAYKNKEQAERHGEIVELPYKTEKLQLGDTVYYLQNYFNDATLQHERKVKRTVIDYIAKDYIEVNNGVWLSVENFWLTPEEAERRLAELRGEK